MDILLNSSKQDAPVKTRLALLGTMGTLHQEPLGYDFECLRSIVVGLSPDILCAEVTRPAWESGNLEAAALEIREVLTPITRLTDSVLVPVAPTSQRFDDFIAPPGWRQSLVRAFDRLLRWGQRKADNPEAMHKPVFESFCHTVCVLTEMTWTVEDRSAWENQNINLANAILEAVRRDPGSRMLVVVQCQRFHKLEPLLKKFNNEIDLVDYWEL